MSTFSSEVSCQAAALKDLLTAYEKTQYYGLHQAKELINQSDTIVFTGMGTSFYAPQFIIKDFSEGIRPIIIETHELLQNNITQLRKNDVLVVISQSGESVEIRRLCSLLNHSNPIIAITNDQQSTLARYANVVLPLYAGEEKSITNKTFTNTLAVLYLFSNLLIKHDFHEAVLKLHESVSYIKEIVEERVEEIQEYADILNPADVIHFIGRNGSEITLANQAALIFMEGSGCNARAFTSGGFRHGPIEVCSPDHRCVFFVSSGDTAKNLFDLAEYIQNFGSKIVFITNQQNLFHPSILVKGKSQIQFLIEAAVVMELVLIRVAQNRNRVAGEFTITSKICKLE